MKPKRIFIVFALLFIVSACGFTAEGKIKGEVNLPQPVPYPWPQEETSGHSWSWGWGGMSSGGTSSTDGWRFDEKGRLHYEVHKYGRNR